MFIFTTEYICFNIFLDYYILYSREKICISEDENGQLLSQWALDFPVAQLKFYIVVVTRYICQKRETKKLQETTGIKDRGLSLSLSSQTAFTFCRIS